MKIWLLTVLILLGCNSPLAVSPDSSRIGRVTGLDRVVTQPGDVVTVSGTYLRDMIRLTLNGQDLEFVVASDNLGSFTVPSDAPSGTLTASFKVKEKEIGSFALLNAESGTEGLPVYSGEAQLVCTDFIYRSMAGIVGRGTRSCLSFPDCTIEGQSACVTTAGFPAVDKANLESKAASVRSDLSIAGVNGTLANCASDGESNCFASAAFPAVVKANVTAGIVKSGSTIAGVTGDYPSATFPLAVSDGAIDLEAGTFDAQLSTGMAFGWFDRNGARHSSLGTSNLAVGNIKSGVTIFGNLGTFAPPCTADGIADCLTTTTFKSADTSAFTTWDIRRGKTVAGVAGSVSFFKNLADLTTFNQLTGTGTSISTSDADAYDTLDDLNNGKANLPTTIPAGFGAAPGANWIRDSISDDGAGGGTAANGVCDGTEDCVVFDRLAGIYWSKRSAGNPNWGDAIDHCENLSYGARSDWRVPTAKEMLQAHINGIWSQRAGLNLVHTQYWSSTTISEVLGNAWTIAPSNGTTSHESKFNGYFVICVRTD